MFAVIELKGHQYLIKEQDLLRVDKMAAEEGKTAMADKVLLVSNEKETKIGAPYIHGASVELQVLKTGLGEKVRTFKMKAKKRYKRLRGHREPFTDVRVLKIKP